jgi:hypothetical protein
MKRLAELFALLNGILVAVRLVLAALRALKLDGRLVRKVEAWLDRFDAFIARPVWAR